MDNPPLKGISYWPRRGDEAAPWALIGETMAGIIRTRERNAVALSKHRLSCSCARDGNT